LEFSASVGLVYKEQILTVDYLFLIIQKEVIGVLNLALRGVTSQNTV